MPVTTTTPNKWQLVLTERFRQIIQDTDDQFIQYEDEAIRDILITAAKLVSGDLGLHATYDVNTETTFITPDPLNIDGAGTEDEAFTNLILLRAHLIIVTGEWKKSVKQSTQIQFGPRVHVNTSVQAQQFAALVKELRAQYKDELAKYQLNSANIGGRIVIVMSGAPVGPNHQAEPEGLPIHGWLSN
jgi:hypothetical protein